MAESGKKKSKRAEAVENIELSSKNISKRMIIFVLLLGVGITAFGYALYLALSTEKGWKKIEANTTSELNCSEDFVFLYNIGHSGNSATAENKLITNLYSETTEFAYQIFTTDQGYDDLYNVYYINEHPNEEIVVEDVLYDAFSLVQEYENREIYLAPIYMHYDDIFYAKEDYETADFDPYVNEEVADYYAEVSSYAKNQEAVDIQLLGDNKIKLHVSDEYLQYASENSITNFIDFNWMKNAFIIDYIADVMIDNGYRFGTISSFDGFSRNLDDSGESFSFNIFDKMDQSIYTAAVMEYKGAQSIVYLRNYIMNSLDIKQYCQMDNGEVRTSYLDVNDGKCKSAINNMVSYSKSAACAEILLNISPVYIADTFQEERINQLTESDIYSIYCMDYVIYYNDSEINLANIYKTEEVVYTACYKK